MKMSGLIELIKESFPISEIKKYLDEHPEEIHILDMVHSPLYMAAYRGRTDLVELLLSRGANIEQKILFNETCIMHYLHSFSLEISMILINSCKNINIQDMNRNTPIMNILTSASPNDTFCSRQKVVNICKYMLDTRTDLNLSIHSFSIGKTAYQIAIIWGYPEIAESIKYYNSLETKCALD